MEVGVTYHLIVLFRLGWLTVLSSMKIVEQELYFFVRSPGDICKERERDKDAWTRPQRRQSR